MTLRIGMWSGPRNISTALMRSWENRGDCHVSDEPLYAAYLAATGLDHPGRDAIIANGQTRWQTVVTDLTQQNPGQAIWYQKHMSHHLLPGMDTEWVHQLHNVLLIRDPRLVVASYTKSRAQVSPPDIGLLQQWQLWQTLNSRQAHAPLVVDAEDFLKAPEAYLQALCASLGVPFTPRMLHWPAGPRQSDGIWAPYWYEAVWRSTGFEPWRERTPQLNAHDEAVAQACMPAYAELFSRRLRL